MTSRQSIEGGELRRLRMGKAAAWAVLLLLALVHVGSALWFVTQSRDVVRELRSRDLANLASALNPIGPGEHFEFRRGRPEVRALHWGWWVADTVGTWQRLDRAQVVLVPPTARTWTADIEWAAFARGPSGPRPLRIEVGDRPVAEASVGGQATNPSRIAVRVTHQDVREGLLTFHFLSPEPRSPLSLGINSDARPLGIRLISATVVSFAEP